MASLVLSAASLALVIITNVVTVQTKDYVLMTQNKMTWQEAYTACQQKGHHLATVKNEDEHNKLVQLLNADSNTSDDLWIALNSITGDFMWMADSMAPLVFNKWASGEPSHKEDFDCVSVDKDKKWKWETNLCTDNAYFVCEK